jgi:hypothetical protein
MRILLLLLPLAALASRCYSVDKEYLTSNLTQNESLLVELPDSFTDSFNAYISYDTPRYIKYAGVNDQYCSKSKENLYECGADDDGGSMVIKQSGNKLYLKIGCLRLAQTTDDPIVYQSCAKKNEFIEVKKSACIKDLDAIIKVDKKIPPKIINSLLKMKNIIITDISTYKNAIFAVGLDNSKSTREKQRQDEYLKFISLYSNNSGKSWQRNSSEQIPLYKVIATNSKEAIAIGTIEGSGGFVSITKDGGKSWQTLYEGGFLNDITKVNNCYYAAGFGIIKSCNNKKWQKVLDIKDSSLDAIKAVDKNLIVAVGEDILLVSNDGGKNWQKPTLEEKNMLQNSFSHQIYLEDGKIYISAKHPEGFKIVSTNKGKSWKLAITK